MLSGMDYINFHPAPVLQLIRVFLPFLKNSKGRPDFCYCLLCCLGVGVGGWKSVCQGSPSLCEYTLTRMRTLELE